MLRKLAAVAVVVGFAGFGAAAIAGDRGKNFQTDLSGFEEVPSVSTVGNAQVDMEVNRAASELRFTLRYRNLESAVTQAHIHFGQKDVNGGVVLFFCSNLGNGPAGTPPCPVPQPGETATVTGTRRASDMAGGATAQGIAPGQFEEFVRALRAGVTYANVHSVDRPGGEVRGQVDEDGSGDD